MSDERLPIHIDPVRLARTGAQLQGHLPIAPMARLVAALVSSEGEAAVELEFGFDLCPGARWSTCRPGQRCS